MKKVIYSICILLMVMSCGSSKTVRTSKKVIKGNWSLSSITYDRTGTYNIKLLNDVSKACFESSTWQFIPNDFKGTYSISNSECETGERHFKFDIQEIDTATGLYDFLLKPTDEKYKSDTNKGFRLKLAQLSETSMQWQQTVNVEGKPFIINMNFTKSE